jgi:hypothetical protein
VHFHSDSYQNFGVERFASFENSAGPCPYAPAPAVSEKWDIALGFLA